jgi:hypothetical protein
MQLLKDWSTCALWRAQFLHKTTGRKTSFREVEILFRRRGFGQLASIKVL